MAAQDNPIVGGADNHNFWATVTVDTLDPVTTPVPTLSPGLLALLAGMVAAGAVLFRRRRR